MHIYGKDSTSFTLGGHPYSSTSAVRYESRCCSSDQSCCQSCAQGELSPSSYPGPPLHHANTICHTSSELGPPSHTYCIIVSAEQAEEGIDISIIIDKSMPGKRNERQIS